VPSKQLKKLKKMKLTLLRYQTQLDSTSGLLFLDNQFICYTLEDQYQTEKVPGETCIPKGTYPIVLRKEGRSHTRYAKRFPGFHQGMLYVKDVPGFQWILIHIGNTDDDTAGCILVGNGVQGEADQSRLINSTRAYQFLYPKVSEALLNGETVWLDIVGF
ncbi:MAG: DUF5675 family protein, partial [Carboxylicivirga sp.]|nr:DUF5675 family protein [Carboxylicivirga sp.]